MIVYRLNPDPDYPGIRFVDINCWFDVYSDLESSTKRINRKWLPPKCRHDTMADFHDATCRTKRQSQSLFDRGPADFAMGLPAYSERAVKMLAPRMKNFGEFLPLDIDGESKSYFYYHCTQLLEVLDMKLCEAFESDGKITGFMRLVFDRSKMANAYVFRLAETPNSCRVFVTDEFVREMPSDLTGFVFNEVWRDSDELPLAPKKKSARKGG